MKAAKIDSKEFHTHLQPVQRQLQSWRQTRKHRERIPEILWSAMAQLAASYGVSRVSQALRIEYPALKRRVHRVQAANRQEQTAAFVEFKMPAPAWDAGSVIELQDRWGAKMTVRLAQSSSADLLGLAQAFWRRGA
jgi:hypothetical protein